MKANWKTYALAALAAVALYAFAGFVLAPVFVKHRVENSFTAARDWQLLIDHVAVNPFMLVVTFTGMSLNHPQSAAKAEASEMYVRLSPVSLFGRVFAIREMRVAGARMAWRAAEIDAERQRRGDGLASLMKTLAVVRDLRIDQLSISQAQVEIRSAKLQGIAARPDLDLTAIDFRIDDLRAIKSEQNEFEVSASLDAAARLQASGWLLPSRGAADTANAVSRLDPADNDTGLGPEPMMWISSASPKARGRIAYANGQAAFEGDVALLDLEVIDASTGDRLFAAPAVAASVLRVDTESRQPSFESVRVEKPFFSIDRGPGRARAVPAWLMQLATEPLNAKFRFDTVTLAGGRLDFSGSGPVPAARIVVDELNGIVTMPTPESVAKASVSGRFGGGGSGELSASWVKQGFGQSSRFALRLSDVDVAQLSPYFAGVIGRQMQAGKLYLDLYSRVNANWLQTNSTLVVDGLRLAPHVETAVVPDLGFDLAVALLRDEADHIEFALPIARTRIDVGFDPHATFAEALRAYTADLAAAPFEVLGRLADRPGQDLKQIEFPAGSAMLTPSASERLVALGQALALRPSLGLTIAPAYDPIADRDSLARDQVRLHIALATSAGPPSRQNKEAIALGDSRVRAILDEFAANRLLPEKLNSIVDRFPLQDDAYYQAVYAALVENEEVARTALKTLARYRGQSVLEQLVGTGTDAARVRLVDQSAMSRGETAGAVVTFELWAVPVERAQSVMQENWQHNGRSPPTAD